MRISTLGPTSLRMLNIHNEYFENILGALSIQFGLWIFSHMDFISPHPPWLDGKEIQGDPAPEALFKANSLRALNMQLQSMPLTT